VDIYLNPAARDWLGGRRVDCLSFHVRLPNYRPSPVRVVHGLAESLGLGAVLIKDESERFDLSAFKMLGASYGVYRTLVDRLGALPDWQNVIELRRALAGAVQHRRLRLLTATAGNHGRAVSRVGSWLGLPTVVYVPDGTSREVVAAIVSDGADVRIVEGSYDQAVLTAADLASREDRWLLVQDTAWPGYEHTPSWIVDGYHTLFHELDGQLAEAGQRPDLVVVPVGVGSLMSAAIEHYRTPVAARPALLAVEPVTAACALASLHAGGPASVPTAPTVMAGLNAGTLSSTAWPLLSQGVDAAIAVTDAEVRHAQEVLAGMHIGVGFCGSATLAGITAALTQPGSAEVRAALDLTTTSTVVLIGTDGSAH
jgi:diaminopropionate ammonia-lyase